jgi:hypothetical protein
MEVTPRDILYYITVFDKPDNLVETARGQMSYRDWLEQVELPRFLAREWPVKIVTNKKTGEIALAHVRIRLINTPKQ